MDASSIKIWRVIDLLKWSKAYLADKGVASAQIEVEWLLRHVLNCSRIEIYLNHERPLNPEELATFKKLLLERSRGVPLQYVLGFTEFMGRRFLVNPDVLIPRPETEIVVERVLDWLKDIQIEKPAVLDVGTGSGCIAVSIAAENKNCAVLALDISAKALAVARENASQNGVEQQIRFLQKDILQESPGDCEFNIIVSNPPYVAGKYWDDLEALVRENEPEIALNPGKDGLIFYRRLSELANRHLSENGILAMEIGGDYQEKDVCHICTQSGLEIRAVVKDYSGQSRGIIAGRMA
jgi:release factor glutamine methyltransferase